MLTAERLHQYHTRAFANEASWSGPKCSPTTTGGLTYQMKLNGALLSREYAALLRLVDEHAASVIFTKDELDRDEPRRFIAKLEVLSGMHPWSAAPGPRSTLELSPDVSESCRSRSLSGDGSGLWSDDRNDGVAALSPESLISLGRLSLGSGVASPALTPSLAPVPPATSVEASLQQAILDMVDEHSKRLANHAATRHEAARLQAVEAGRHDRELRAVRHQVAEAEARAERLEAEMEVLRAETELAAPHAPACRRMSQRSAWSLRLRCAAAACRGGATAARETQTEPQCGQR